MNELLGYFSREARLAILLAVIGPLVYWFLRRKKSADNSGKIETGNITAGGDVNVAGRDIIININIASPEDLQKRLKEEGKSLPKEFESCFVPGVKELEAGRKLLQYGKEAQARCHLEEAIGFFICAADAIPCYETYFNLASAYRDSCDYDNAKENYQKAIQHDPSQPGGYNGLGIVYYHTSDYPNTENYFHQALAKAEKLTDQQARLIWQANAFNNLGIVYTNTGHMEQALAHYQQTLIIFREIGDKLGEAHALNNLGEFYRRIGHMEQAREHHLQVLEIFREIGNKLGEASSLMNLGNVYCQTGQMKQALEHHQQALEIFREIGDKLGEANALNNLGLVYRKTGQKEQGLKHFQQALKIDQEIGNKLEEANALHNLGSVYRLTGQVEQAREHYLSARAIFEQIGTLHLVKQTDESLAKLP